MTTTTRQPAAPTVPTPWRPAAETMTGVATMVGLVVRRNRVRLAVWWLVIVGLFGYVLALQGHLHHPAGAG